MRRAILLTLSLLSGCAAAGAVPATLPGTRLATATSGGLDPGDTGAFLAGRFAAQQGDLDIAADAFLKVLADDPGNQDVAEQAFLACLLAGRPETASLARGLSDNPLALMLLGDRDAKRGAWTAAERRFATLPSQGMGKILQPLLLAWAQAGAGRPDQALNTLKPVSSGDRFAPFYVLHAALIADLTQRDPQAARLYAMTRSDFPQPNLAVARALASWDARHGDPDAARKTLTGLVTASPEFGIVLPGLLSHMAQPLVTSATDGMAEAYVALAASLEGQDAGEPAALLLRLALDLEPKLATARLLSAQIDDDAHRADTALATLEGISPDDPLAPLADMRRAALLQRTGRPNEALAVLTRLSDSLPDQSAPWVLRASILRAQHRDAEAAAAYTQAIDRVRQPGRQDWGLFFERGIAEDRAGHWPAAEADFDRALTLWPDQPSVLNYLGYSWTEQGRNLDRARRMIERAVTEQPNDGAILDSLGWVMLRQGDVAGAIRNLERAVELEPEDATINGHLGDAYLAAGRKQEATYQWRRALTLNPDPDEKERIAGKLREAGGPIPVVGEQAAPKPQP